MRRISGLSALVGLSALLLSGSALAGGGLAVPSDQVKVVQFPQSVATVYVGNPSIADVTMIDATHAFLIGKNYGTTNIIALDVKGDEVFNKPVTVSGGSSLISIHHGLARTTVSCTSARCEATPMPGDVKPPFDDYTNEMDKRVVQAKQASTPEQPQ